jgi:hypothetical protein
VQGVDPGQKTTHLGFGPKRLRLDNPFKYSK